mgnify:CR=1 FL=1
MEEINYGHKPVLLHECLDALAIKPDGVYLDGTLGRAGHSLEIVRRLTAGGRLIALDRDETAIEAAQRRLADYMDRVTLVHSNFSALDDVLREIGVRGVDGMLFDLGVSSPQLDDAARGFSYKQDAPLDMRMDESASYTARELVNTVSYEELKRIVDSGEWGAVVSAMFFRGGSTPQWSFEDWLRKKEKSGGVLLDQHVHDVDTIHWLFGTPESVQTLARNVIPGSGYDAVSTNYFYPDGKVVNAMDDWTINGDFGFEMIFRVNFEKGCAVLTRDGLTLYPVGKPAVVPDLPADDGYYREMLYFQSCLRAGTAPERCTPLSTMETIRIAQAEQLSADRGGERVRL